MIELISKKDRLIQVIQESKEISAAYLFGSAAQNVPVINDLDILVLLCPDVEPYSAYFDLTCRIAQFLDVATDQIDVLFFDLNLADPDILYEAVDKGILLKDDAPALLTDRIEDLSRYFLENDFLIEESKRLRKEMIKDFYGSRSISN